MGARIAIAMAVYNDGRYLEQTLTALAASEHRDFSVVVVDDGSTDDSAAVAERFAAQLDIAVHRAGHRGIYETKREAVQRTDQSCPYLMTLDSDILLPPDALGRMAALLDANPDVAAVSARALAIPDSALHQGVRFLELLFHQSNATDTGARWIVGGATLYRRAALDGVAMQIDMGEDAGFAEQLRDRWRFLCPSDLEAGHLGEPATLLEVLRRGTREGMRVAAMHRRKGATVQLQSLARLVPLPLAVLAVGGAVAMRPLIASAAALGLAGYVGAFLVASRTVPAGAAVRITAALLFTWGNFGFAVGYARHRLGPAAPLREGPRTSSA